MMPSAAARTKTGPARRGHAGRPGAAAVGTRAGRSPRRGDAARPRARARVGVARAGPPLLVVLARSHPRTPHGRTGTGMAEPRYGTGAGSTPGRTTAAKNGGASNGRASKGHAAVKPSARSAAKPPVKPSARSAAKPPVKPSARSAAKPPVKPPANPPAKPAAKGLTPAERAARGKAARGQAPRESHAAFDPPPDRPDPVSLLESQALTRVPELVPVRYGRMMVSPFTYYRGAALPMANDLATTPRSGLVVQACGDAHLSNFGLFASAERNLIFDVNDFDETLPAPWEWDVKRLAASLEVAARENGFGRKDRRKILL